MKHGEEGERREKLCSCGSTLNNHGSVSGSTQQQRTSCGVEWFSQGKNADVKTSSFFKEKISQITNRQTTGALF